MDSRDNFRERFEALEQQMKQLKHQSQALARQARWWRGIACIVGFAALLLSMTATARVAYAAENIIPQPVTATLTAVQTNLPNQQAPVLGPLQPAPVHQLSPRAQQVKAGAVQPVAPGATPIAMRLPSARTKAPSARTDPPSLGTPPFEGVDQCDLVDFCGQFPPDGGLGVGPLYIVQVTNDSVAYFTKNGAKVFETDKHTFFGTNTDVTDPDVMYDQESGRFFAVAIAGDPLTTLLAAASLSSDPRDGWCVYSMNASIPAGATTDFTQMGISDTALWIGLNQDNVGPTINGLNLTIWVDKVRMTSCAFIAPGGSMTGLTQCDGRTNVRNLRPAKMFSGGNQEFLAGTAQNNMVAVWRVSDPLGSPTFDRACITTKVFDPPPDAPQPGGGFPLNTGDDRLLEVVERDGHLYTAHNGAGGSCTDTSNAVCTGLHTPLPCCSGLGVGSCAGRCSTLFFKEIDVSRFPTLRLVQDVFFDIHDFHLFYPTFDVDSLHQLGIGASSVSVADDHFARAVFTSRDGAGNYSDFGVLAEGQNNKQQFTMGSTRNRWGDYFGASVDVCTNRGHWMEVQYAGPDALRNASTWNTVIGNILTTSPPPENDSCAGGVQFFFPSTTTIDATLATFSETDPLDNFGGCTGNRKNNSSVWFFFQAPADGTVTLDTFGSNYNTVLSVFFGGGLGLPMCPSSIAVACNDDAGFFEKRSQVTFDVLSGVYPYSDTYW